MDKSGRISFIIAGVQKCGTTSLAEHLSHHPDVGFCREKEPHFFSKSFDPHDSSELKKYHSLYDFSDDKVFGEASTSYMFSGEYHETAERIRDYNPDMKIIVLLRDPVARVKSHVYHRMRKGLIPKGDVLSALNEQGDYFDRSRYHRQLEYYYRVFPRSQIKVILFEDFVKDQSYYVDEVCEFIGVDKTKMPEIDEGAKNISDAKTRLSSIPFANSIISVLEKQSWAWKLTPYIPMKTLLPKDIDGLIWRHIERDICRLAGDDVVDVSSWVRRYGNASSCDKT